MHLKKVRVRDFRCIEDSEEFSLDQITCLVGKNESGKTAILKALYKLKPDAGAAEKFLNIDYPRRKWRPNIPIPESPPAISTEWELNDAEHSALEKQFGKGSIPQRAFTITKGYENKRQYDTHVSEKHAVKHFTAQLDAAEKKPLADAEDIKSLKEALLGIANRTPSQEGLNQKLAKEFKGDVEDAVIAVLDEMVPTFLFFDQYLRLPGQVAVDLLVQHKTNNQLSDTDKMFLALLALAGTTIEDLQGAKTFEEFNAALRNLQPD
jgi:energy-coupling factor transporter ATP-binding protein EcfA2